MAAPTTPAKPPATPLVTFSAAAQSELAIECRKRFGQWMLTGKPYATVNGREHMLQWGHNRLKVPSKQSLEIALYFPYQGRVRGKATAQISPLRPGQHVAMQYVTPAAVSLPGTLLAANGDVKVRRGVRADAANQGIAWLLMFCAGLGVLALIVALAIR